MYIELEEGVDPPRFEAHVRDFDQDFNDSSSLLLNQAAVDYIELKDPVGATLRMDDRDYTVTGVLNNVVMTSPYEPANRTVFVFCDSYTPGMVYHEPMAAKFCVPD